MSSISLSAFYKLLQEVVNIINTCFANKKVFVSEALRYISVHYCGVVVNFHFTAILGSEGSVRLRRLSHNLLRPYIHRLVEPLIGAYSSLFLLAMPLVSLSAA